MTCSIGTYFLSSSSFVRSFLPHDKQTEEHEDDEVTNGRPISEQRKEQIGDEVEETSKRKKMKDSERDSEKKPILSQGGIGKEEEETEERKEEGEERGENEKEVNWKALWETSKKLKYLPLTLFFTEFISLSIYPGLIHYHSFTPPLSEQKYAGMATNGDSTLGIDDEWFPVLVIVFLFLYLSSSPLPSSPFILFYF